MFFLDLKGLIETIKTDKNFPKTSYHYLIANLVLGLLLDAFGVLGRDGTGSLAGEILGELIGAIIVGFIFFAAILRFHRLNGGSDGQHFIDKLVSINWVVGLRLMTVWLPALVVVGFLAREISSLFVLPLLGIIVYGIIYVFQQISAAFKEIRQHETSEIETAKAITPEKS